LLADQPFVNSGVVDGLIALYEQRQPPIARPRYDGQPGNPVLWDRSLFDELLAQTGDQGGRTVLQKHAQKIAWLDLPDARVQMDVDTPEAYASLTAEQGPPATEPSQPHPHDNAQKYCQRCAAPLEIRPVRFDNNRPHPTCPACGFIVWTDPKVAVLAVIPWEGGILLGERTQDPGKGGRSFPSGFVDRGEPLEEALVREVLEETGLTVEIEGLIGVYSARGNPTVVIAYAVEPRGGTLRGEDDLIDLRAFPADALPPMAFAHDERIVRDWRAFRARSAQQPAGPDQ
jgi:8-oxo-dGTP diphosphatase